MTKSTTSKRGASKRETGARLRTIGRDCTCHNLRKATRAVTQYYDSILQPSGLRATQVAVLTAAAIAGPAPIGRLAEQLGMDRTTLTRNLAPLEKSGLICSGDDATSSGDRRARLVEITATGRKALARAMPLWEQAQSSLIGRLGTQRWRELLRHLDAAIAAV